LKFDDIDLNIDFDNLLKWGGQNDLWRFRSI
jgi:hypothetical protein